MSLDGSVDTNIERIGGMLLPLFFFIFLLYFHYTIFKSPESISAEGSNLIIFRIVTQKFTEVLGKKIKFSELK